MDTSSNNLGAARLRSLFFVFGLSASQAIAQVDSRPLDQYISSGSDKSTGYVPDDAETLKGSSLTPTFRNFLPYSVDLSDRFPRPASQGAMGSCVAWAVGYAARSYYATTLELRPKDKASFIPSPAYIYHSVRDSECDGGSRISEALDLLKVGSLSLARMPYSDTSCRRPTEAETEEAIDFKIRDWKRVDYSNQDQLKAELANGNPVVFAISETPDSFQRLTGSRIYRQTELNNRPNSGHAMTMVGYDDNKGAFRFINSWGTDWGDKGFGWIGYESARALIDSAYVMEVDQVQIPIPVVRPDKPEPPVLDGIDLAKYECASLSMDTSSSPAVLNGFLGYQKDLDELVAAAKTAGVSVNAVLRPWPQCEALITLSEYIGKPEAPELTVEGGQNDLAEGELLALDVVTPPHPTYLYLSYIQADGTVVNMHQPTGLVANQLPPRTKLRFGDGNEGRARFTVSGPFGQELVIAVAAASPLFSEPLPRMQTEREYLSAMRSALIGRLATAEPRTASSTVLEIRTRPTGSQQNGDDK